MRQSIYEQLQAKCRDKQISVRELTKRAGVKYERVANWKRHQPAYFDDYERLIEELEKIVINKQ